MQPLGVHGVTPVKCALPNLSRVVVVSSLIFALEHVKMLMNVRLSLEFAKEEIALIQ